ncbi:STAS domain-containing protein [Streptomyces sp. NPDC051561]|uniref:STAS domain-containing protein n=1 Tax=Streptomyces sp. NPDC051561 TaxID=3365658 RepID=UPI0037AEC444
MNTTAGPSHILPTSIPISFRTCRALPGRGTARPQFSKTPQFPKTPQSHQSPPVIASCRAEGTTLKVAVQGEIDHFSAAPLSAMLASAAAFGHTRLVVDASRVTFCDSGFLNALLAWRRGGRRLILAATSAAVRRLLAASRSGRLLARESLRP